MARHQKAMKYTVPGAVLKWQRQYGNVSSVKLVNILQPMAMLLDGSARRSSNISV